MSWAEDNGIDGFDVEDELRRSAIEREQKWRQGFHVTKDRGTKKISEMTTEHLENTIRHFNGLDTSPLRRELESRKK